MAVLVISNFIFYSAFIASVITSIIVDPNNIKEAIARIDTYL